MNTLDTKITARKIRNRYYEQPARVSIQPVIDEALKMSSRKADELVEQEKREMGTQTNNDGCLFPLGVGLFCVIVLAGLAVAL